MVSWKRNLGILAAGVSVYLSGSYLASREIDYKKNNSATIEQIVEIPKQSPDINTQAAAGATATALGLAGLLMYGTLRKRK